MNWEIIEETGSKAKIKVIGVGGAGGKCSYSYDGA